jgi:hypothetical protein
MRALAFTIAFVVGLSSVAFADDDGDRRWGISIWGLSYHVDRKIDYDKANVGLGLRFYLTRYVFVEGDALRNSNRGITLPASVGIELGIGSVSPACRLSVVGASTIAYYQNLRTETDYFKVGPVPGLAVTCARVKTNVIAILGPSRQLLAALAVSLTILL